jgi:hypothetical protein
VVRIHLSLLVAAAVTSAILPASRGDGPRPVSIGLDLARYELGRRMKAFEADWEKTRDPAAKKRAAAKLEELHSKFLTLRFTEAGRTLDHAAHALRSENDPGSTRQWVTSLVPIPAKRLVDGTTKELTVTIQPLYPVKGNPPKDLEVQLWFSDKQIVTAKPTQFPYVAKVPLPPLGDFRGLDRKLYFMAEAGKVLHVAPVGISQIADLDARLAKLRTIVASWPSLDTIEKATVRDRLAQLEEVKKGVVQEIDVPVAGLLENAEAMAKSDRFFAADRSGQFWMSVPVGKDRAEPIRVSVPRGLDPAKPVPVVAGLHGAGGSENLFFAGYGGGRGVRAAERRGWIFITTRSGLDFTSAPPVAEILDALAKRYPIDSKRVFLIGHSMGAGQAVRLAEKHPGRFAAIAALGGGAEVKKSDAFTTLPVFVAAGEEDFAKGYAKELSRALEAAGAKAATYREYPGADHLLIVREALPDVFKMFEQVAERN